MEIFGLSIKGTVKPNTRILAVPVTLIIVLSFMALKIGQNGIARITTKIKELREAQRVEHTLDARATLLGREEGVVLGQADLSTVALPEKNPSLLMLNQLSLAAERHALDLAGKKVAQGVPTGQGVLSGQVSFVLIGNLQEIIEFLKEIKTLAPISTIDEVNIKIDGGEARVNANLSVYWSSFPRELPPISQPIDKLSQEEQSLINRISQLLKPEFVTLPPSAPVEREDPFN